MGKRKLDMTEEEKQEEELYLKKPAPHTVVKHQIDQEKRLIVILEKANVEVVQVSIVFLELILLCCILAWMHFAPLIVLNLEFSSHI